MKRIFYALLLVGTCALATDKGPLPPAEPRQAAALEESICTNQSLVLSDGAKLSYTSHVGFLRVQSREKNHAANLSFTAYFAEQKENRPIAFCFNGGPGSSSVWLHLGFLGPKTVELPDLCHPTVPPGCVNNPLSLLKTCDLVFVDPASTGFSQAEDAENSKKFHGVTEDAYSLASFIQTFLTKFNRWKSPKFLIGESYGTLRAIEVSRLLQEKFFVDINGLILVSLLCDLRGCDDLASDEYLSIAALPTCAAIAHYHGRLKPPFSQMSPKELVEETCRFAAEEYAPALLHGSFLPEGRKKHISQRLFGLTSISQDSIENFGLRMTRERFITKFLQNEGKIVGTHDGRYIGHRVAPDCLADELERPNPSYSFISSAFTCALNEYLINDLKWKGTSPYVILSEGVHPWDWSTQGQSPGLGYLSVTEDFRRLLGQNPDLKVFVAAGYYDLATLYFDQLHSIRRLQLPPELEKNVIFKGYPSGHMIYINPAARKALCEDLFEFLQLATKKAV